MSYTYTTVDGQRVVDVVARDFAGMAAEFKRVFGLTLHVREGIRTRERQLYYYNGWINRLPGFNLALHPDNPLAYHVESNPRGPRALDIYDSGNDAGVTVIGSRRNNWIRDNAHRWGFTLAGLTFDPKEGWHIEYTRALTGSGGTADGSWPARARYGEAWVKSAQTKLKAMGLYSGEIDGKDGPGTQAGTKVLQGAAGLDQDGIFGPQTNSVADVIMAGGNWSKRPVSEIQAFLNSKGFNVGAVDNEWGGKTSFGTYRFQRSVGMTADAQWGPATDAKAFPSTTPPVTPPERVATARTPVYSPAVRAWSLPWAEDRAAGDTPNCIWLHHQASTNDDEGYFKTKNERGSWPTFQVKASGEVVEFANPDTERPQSTQNNNARGISIETQNISREPLWGISDASHESIAQIVAWASKRYNFPIDRSHVRKHNEVYATVCPGPSMDVDRIIKRAIEINTPTPDPGEEVIPVPKKLLQPIYDFLKKFFG